MGDGSFKSEDYTRAAANLASTGQTFQRSATAQATGNYRGSIAEILDPRKLKNGVRESVCPPGFEDTLAVIVGIDGTGSMEQVPHYIQRDLPKLIELLREQGVTEHPNVLFMCFDDERAIPPDAVFQMSQFEADGPKLLEALNEMIIPNNGGGNRGEAYNLVFYAAARHTTIESFEKEGRKGFLILIGDEEPYYENGDPTKHGTSPALAKEVFGDTIEKEVTMLESIREAAERFEIFVIRPGHTSHGKNPAITKEWQKLLSAAGVNAEHVLELAETEAIVTTMVTSIARLSDVDESDLVDVLNAKGATGVAAAMASTRALVPVSGAGRAVTAKPKGELATAGSGGRKRA